MCSVCLPAAALPTRSSFADESRCRFRAMSSRHALASLSTRAGRFLSLSKVMEQSDFDEATGGGGGGATIATVVEAVALRPLSSITLQVMETVPGAAPAVDRVAVVPLPAIEPEVAL